MVVLQSPSWIIPVLTSARLLATDSLDSKEVPDTTHLPFQNRDPGDTLFSSPSCTGQDMYLTGGPYQSRPKHCCYVISHAESRAVFYVQYSPSQDALAP